jgi:hypothetical protein
VSVESFADWLASQWPQCGPKANFLRAARSAAGLIGTGRATEDALRRRVMGYRAWCDGGGVSGPQYVVLPQNWMNPNHPDLPAHGWALEWATPPSKTEQRVQANIDATQEWLRQQEEKDRAAN